MPSESSPLLRAADDDDGSRPASNKPASVVTTITQHLRKWKVIYLCFIFTFVVDFTDFARMAVSIRMVENRLCRIYYGQSNPGLIGPGGEVREALCKVKVVQSQLAEAQGIISMLAYLPGRFKPGVFRLYPCRKL